MSDMFTSTRRSAIMRSVHSQGTGAERKCETLLRSLHLSFSQHCSDLPGKPDFVLRESRLTIFVHGCFWHAHKDCKNSILPTTNREYWIQKIDRNRRRDRRVRDALRRAGWRTMVIWECKLRDPGLIASRLLRLSANGLRKNLR